MIFKKFVSLLIVLTLLFTIVPLNILTYAQSETDEITKLYASDGASSSAEAEQNDASYVAASDVSLSDMNSSAELNTFAYEDDMQILTSTEITPDLTANAISAEDTLVVFDASVSSDISNAISYNTSNTKGSVDSTADSALSGTHALRLNHSVLPAGSQYEAKISKVSVTDITAYSYINLNIWSPEATGENLNILLLNSSQSSKRIRYILTTDWKGWKTVSIPYSSHSNNTLTSITKTVNLFDINIGGWNFTKAKAGYFLVDRIWLTKSAPTEAVCSLSEFENGSEFVSADLGGDKAYSFTFNGNLANVSMTKAIKLEKYGGTSYEASDLSYSTMVDGNKLNVVFNDNLPDGTYRITLDHAYVLSSEYALGTAAAVSYEFSVNCESPYFILNESTVNDGDDLSSLTEIKLTFNKKINSGTYIPEYLYIYRDGAKIYNTYTYAVSGKTITLSFNNTLKADHKYTLEISPDFYDYDGNKYIGTSEISFSLTDNFPASNKLVVFTAAESENFDILDTEYKESTEITNLYPQTAKLTYEQGNTDLNAFITRNNTMNVTGMKYINFLAYLPEKTENPSYVILYAGNALTGNRYELTLDWSGWKIISIPLSSISSKTEFDGILFTMGTWLLENKTSGYILFDAVWFSKDKPAELSLVSQSFPNGYSGAASKAQTLTLSFNAVLDSTSAPGILLADSDGNPVDDFTYVIDGKDLIISFGDLGLPSTAYELTVYSLASEDFSLLNDSVSVNFTTASSGVFVNDYSYSGKSVSAEIENLSDEDVNLSFVAYAIGDNNTLIEKQQKSVSVSKGTANETLSFVTDKEIKQVKAFILNNDKNFVSEKYFSYVNSQGECIAVSDLAGEKPEIKNLSSSLNVNMLTLTADVNAVPNAVVVEILSSSEIISANVVSANDGFEYYYSFPDSYPSGIYEAVVSSGKVSSAERIKYISKADRENLLLLSNGNDMSALVVKLNSLKAYLAISSFTGAQTEDFAKLIIAHKPYGNYVELISFIDSLYALLAEINSAQWSELSDLIINNSDILSSLDSVAYSYFSSLSGTNKGKVSQLIVKKLPASTISEFVTFVAQANEEYKASLLNSSTGGNRTHSGAAASTGSSLGGASFASSANNVTSGTEDVFIDLDGCSWAQESIMKLYENSVISASSDKKFRPNDNITREEFVKMVVCAIIPEVVDNGHMFADASYGAWYNSYLAKAYAASVITGYPDGNFGIGENITREDMVTVCSRALENKGYIFTPQTQSYFSDSASISSYASSYVNAMVELGIINGMGDGSFAPKSYATRAQAAKIIAGLMELN